jgi:UDP-glucose 4-epimerase
MIVAVTGGSGQLGRRVVETLERHDHRVINLDQAPPRIRSERFTRVAFTDYGQTLDALLGIDARHQGFDALVHLAAIPGPGQASDVEIFHNNMTVSFNVLRAALRAGIKNIVYASSETLLGVPFTTDPPYFPADEGYPSRPEWTYALVKHLEDEMVRQFVRWDPTLKVIALRISYVKDDADYAGFPALNDDIEAQAWNLWSYVDSRDAAQAVRKALEYEMVGFDQFLVAAADTVMTRPTQELIAARYPNVPVRTVLGTHESLQSTEKARRLLGYVPEHSWRTTVG